MFRRGVDRPAKASFGMVWVTGNGYNVIARSFIGDP
jgi:hypothetical protein